jgi:hypothetical protein
VLDKFWEAVGGSLADRWAAVSVPALVFWLGGLLAWAQGRGGLNSLRTPTDWLARQPTTTQVTVLIVGLLSVGASGVVINRLTEPALRFLEGYWPSWLDPLRDRLVRRVRDRVGKEQAKWQEVAPDVQEAGEPDPATARAFQRLDQRLRHRPSAPGQLMPTRLGNVLRAAESRPADKYGLDAVAVWPCLWLILPDSTRQELAGARASLDSAVASFIWGALFLVFTPWTILVVPIGLAVSIGSVLFWLPSRAEAFGDLLEAAFDLHRVALYQQLRWPLPTDPRQEWAEGERLTDFLWRGSREPYPTFTPPL